MLTSKVLVSELDLYDGILCGSAACSECPETSIHLESLPTSCSDLYKEPHYIIPDTNVVIHQFGVLGESAFKNVIILQTVLEELRFNHSPAYNQIISVISNPDRHFYAFTNERYRSTYTERKPGESSNDRNDRAIRNAVKWYREHLKSSDRSDIDVVLLTNGKDDKAKKAEEEGLTVYTFAEYVKGMTRFPSLIDKLSYVNTDAKNDGHEFVNKKDGFLYPEHWKLSKIQECLKAGTLITGKFQASRENFLEGFVFMGGDDESNLKSVFIQGLKNLNRAVHGDMVAVQILPKAEWSCPASLNLEDEIKNPDVEMDENEGKVLKNKASHKKFSGSVVGIIKRNWRPYCGMLQPAAIKGATKYLFVPAERRITKIRIESGQGKKLLSQRITVSIDSWPRDADYPEGHIVKSIGEKFILLEMNEHISEFSEEIMNSLPKLPWAITEKELSCRKDLRNLPICSVDKPGTKDIDDALHCRQLENGNYEIGAHIADVPHFIHYGSEIDNEAAMRGATVYLSKKKRISMIPDLLSSNLCSLRKNEDRLTFSVVWELNEQAKILKTSYYKSVIKSKASLSYAEGQLRVDNKCLNDDITISLRNLNKLSKFLEKQRIDNGALSLASTGIRFAMDTETHDAMDVEDNNIKIEIQSTVQEIMLLTNSSVVQKIHKAFPKCSPLKLHPPPQVANFGPLIKAGQSKGFKIHVHSEKALQHSLDTAHITGMPEFNETLRCIARNCRAQSVYACSGLLDELNYFHHGLNISIYTHFTSPIRRYCDIIVHRLLAVAIGADVTYLSLVDKNKIQALCNHLNYRSSLATLHCHLFEKKKPVDGYILGLRDQFIQILLPHSNLVCKLNLSSYQMTEGETAFINDEERPTQSAAGVLLKQFDQVTIQLYVDRTDIQHQKTTLKLIKTLTPGFSVSPLTKETSTKKQKTKHS